MPLHLYPSVAAASCARLGPARRLSIWCAGALVWALAGCGAPAGEPADDIERGRLRVGRRCELDGVRYTLDARFNVTGPEALELDTNPTGRPATRALAPGSYAIEIHPGFSVWRDVAVAQLQVTTELVSAAEQRFEITGGAWTVVSYEFALDGKQGTFDSD